MKGNFSPLVMLSALSTIDVQQQQILGGRLLREIKPSEQELYKILENKKAQIISLTKQAELGLSAAKQRQKNTCDVGNTQLKKQSEAKPNLIQKLFTSQPNVQPQSQDFTIGQIEDSLRTQCQNNRQIMKIFSEYKNFIPAHMFKSLIQDQQARTTLATRFLNYGNAFLKVMKDSQRLNSFFGFGNSSTQKSVLTNEIKTQMQSNCFLAVLKNKGKLGLEQSIEKLLTSKMIEFKKENRAFYQEEEVQLILTSQPTLQERINDCFKYCPELKESLTEAIYSQLDFDGNQRALTTTEKQIKPIEKEIKGKIEKALALIDSESCFQKFEKKMLSRLFNTIPSNKTRVKSLQEIDQQAVQQLQTKIIEAIKDGGSSLDPKTIVLDQLEKAEANAYEACKQKMIEMFKSKPLFQKLYEPQDDDDEVDRAYKAQLLDEAMSLKVYLSEENCDSFIKSRTKVLIEQKINRQKKEAKNLEKKVDRTLTPKCRELEASATTLESQQKTLATNIQKAITIEKVEAAFSSFEINLLRINNEKPNFVGFLRAKKEAAEIMELQEEGKALIEQYDKDCYEKCFKQLPQKEQIKMAMFVQENIEHSEADIKQWLQYCLQEHEKGKTRGERALDFGKRILPILAGGLTTLCGLLSNLRHRNNPQSVTAVFLGLAIASCTKLLTKIKAEASAKTITIATFCFTATAGALSLIFAFTGCSVILSLICITSISLIFSKFVYKLSKEYEKYKLLVEITKEQQQKTTQQQKTKQQQNIKIFNNNKESVASAV